MVLIWFVKGNNIKSKLNNYKMSVHNWCPHLALKEPKNNKEILKDHSKTHFQFSWNGWGIYLRFPDFYFSWVALYLTYNNSSFLLTILWIFLFRLESPTRSLIMEAPRGVQVSAVAGEFKASCRKELHLQSTEGEVSVYEWILQR